ncbi:CotS family spore coat protein [Tepidibacter aestuarii]|uniref:CotS family spore coat protein n=1 Tax=Tepidibacter aestuarii TaxID=2925782 RepID=UPI0020BF590B|nr:CotS family spore coat protein [Tepidibacter aestuarii]CAH2214332.1 Spore coat-associated protein S [Tepidibacter aestuarii]
MPSKGEDITPVLKEYDINVKGIKLESYKGKKGVWWINTDKGYKILKKQSFSDKTLDFIIDAINHLNSNGVYIPNIIKTRLGDDYVIKDGVCFVLSEAIDGSTLNYSSDENVRRIIHELARFHKASRGFNPREDYKVRTHLGLWTEKYEKEMHKLEKYYNVELNKNEHSEFGKIILKEYPHFYKRINSAIDGFYKKSYIDWVKEVEEIGGLCHQDFTAGNCILENTGRLYILDTDSLTIDIPLRDIRKILNKIMKRQNDGWDYELTKNILKWYNEQNPLKDYQWDVLKPTLTYPHLFVGIMSKYYERREKTWTEQKYVKRLKEMISIEKSVEPIINNFEDIIPV